MAWTRPGNRVLSAWIPLMFFAYTVRAPLVLSQRGATTELVGRWLAVVAAGYLATLLAAVAVASAAVKVLGKALPGAADGAGASAEGAEAAGSEMRAISVNPLTALRTDGTVEAPRRSEDERDSSIIAMPSKKTQSRSRGSSGSLRKSVSVAFMQYGAELTMLEEEPELELDDIQLELGLLMAGASSTAVRAVRGVDGEGGQRQRALLDLALFEYGEENYTLAAHVAKEFPDAPDAQALLAKIPVEYGGSEGAGGGDEEPSAAVRPPAHRPTWHETLTVWAWAGAAVCVASFVSRGARGGRANASVVAFQLCAAVVVYVVGTQYRRHTLGWWLPEFAQRALSPPLVCSLALMGMAAVSSPLGWRHGVGCFVDTAHVSAGELIGVNLGPAVITMAFTTCVFLFFFFSPAVLASAWLSPPCRLCSPRSNAIKQLRPALPTILASTAVLAVASFYIMVGLSVLLGLHETGSAYLAFSTFTHSVSTPMAIPLAEMQCLPASPGGPFARPSAACDAAADVSFAALHCANRSLVACTTALTATLAYCFGLLILDLLKVRHPVVRGVAAGVTGMELSVASLAQRGENGAAAYAALSFIAFAFFSALVVLGHVLGGAFLGWGE